MLEPSQTLLRLRLGGVLPLAERESLLELADVLASRFMYGRLDARVAPLMPERRRMDLEVAAGKHARETAERLKLWADPTYAGQRPEGATPDISAWALLQLYELTEELVER